MENKESRKGFYIGISILIALTLWIFVDIYGSPDGTARTTEIEVEDVPVEYVGESVIADRGLMLVDEGTNAAVTLKLKGTRWNVSTLDRSQLRVRADLSDITSTGTKSITYRIIFPNRKYESLLEETAPSVVTVQVDELYSKTVDIHCEIQGKVAAGRTAGELQMSATSMEIRGQKEVVDAVSYAKVVLWLDNAAGTVTEDLKYLFYDENDALVSSSGIHADMETIRVVLPVNVTKELRLDMEFLETAGARVKNLDYKIQPSTITVTGDAALLENIETIVLDQFDLSSLETSTTEFHHSYAIVVPEGCENLSGVTRATLDISFIDMVSKTVEATQFHSENVPAGKEIKFLAESLPIRIFGKTEDVQAVTSENIRVRVDLSNFTLASGSYTLPAIVEIDTDGDIGISGTYQLRLTISDIPTEDEPAIPEEET